MISPNQLSLQCRLTIVGILVGLFSFAVLTLPLRGHLNTAVPTTRHGLTGSDLDHFTDTAYRTAESFRQEITQALLLAEGILAGERGVKQSKSRHVSWAVAGGDSNGSRSLKLPLLWIRRTPLRPSTTSRRSLVDEVSALSGARCSIFQRINEAGDMLLVSTSGSRSEGKRTIGTVTPASKANGAMNAAIPAVLGNHAYSGASAMEADPILTAYEPISGTDGAVIGMISVSLREAVEAEKIRRSLSGIRPGSRGHIFALYADGSAYGSVAFATGDAGFPFSPSISAQIIRAALKQPDGTVEQRYRLAPVGEMVAHVRYFAPWKWVLGVTVPESEMALPSPSLEPKTKAIASGLWIALVLSLMVAGAVWAWYSAVLSSEILGFAARMKANAEHLLRIDDKIWSAAEEQSREAIQHSRDLREAASAVSELNRSVRAVGNRLHETLRSARACEEHAKNASSQLKGMQGTMIDLSSSNAQVSGLVKDIADIALQSRILALNAGIEAARAGQHGAAFSRVADEFGTLAHRCAQAAKGTTSLLTESIKISDSGKEQLVKLTLELNQACASSQAAEHSLQECLPELNRQGQATGNVSAVLGRVRDFSPTKRQAVNAGEEIRRQAIGLQAEANELSGVINGQRKAKKVNRQPARRPRSSDAKAPEGSQSALRAY